MNSEKRKEIGQQLVAQFSWGHGQKSSGVSEYIITKNLPDDLKSSLPSIEEIEAELGGNDE